MKRHGIVAKIVGGELKLVFVSVIVGIVCGAVIWERHGDQLKAWAAGHKADCPFHPESAEPSGSGSRE